MREKFAQVSAIVIFIGIFIGILSLVENLAKEEVSIAFIIALVSVGL